MSDFVSSGTTTTKTSSDIEIDGVPMPGLKLNGLTVTKEKIWSKNTGRAANGEMVGDLIAIKYTLKCSWPPLTREQVAVIDKAVSPAFFNVTFLDPGTNTKVTKSTSMNFNSMINDRPVVYMSAQIPEAGNASTSITVQDRDLYEANRAECRKDIEAFNQIVYAAEDERVTGGTADETEK